jgi:two-component system sensor histidine kinase TctE
MKPFPSSIRKQLLWWLVIPIVSLWVVDGAVTYFLAIDLANEAYDRDLASSARSVATRLSFADNKATVDLPPAAAAILKDDDKDKFYYQVVGPHDHLISGDKEIPRPFKGGLYKEPRFRNGEINHQPVRIAAMLVPVPNRPGEFVLVQMAQTLVQRTELVNKILITVVLPEMLMIAFAAFAVWLGVSRGLAPLQVVTNAVASRTQWDLRPLDEDEAPKEISPLVHAINDLLKRLQNDMDAQRRFVANAAHQLRTPLAGLKTQTQLALRTANIDDVHHALKQIHTSADRSAKLVNQLLVLARVEPQAMAMKNYGPQDLNAAARAATESLVTSALRKAIDLGFESPNEQVFVHGEALSLHELAFNLIENAVRYTQDGGKVTVRVERAAKVQLVVEDNGPGIPSEERERVFERFYRVLGTSTSGSGLGLAIVREIAEALSAEVQLGSGPGGVGTKVTVSFVPSAVAKVELAVRSYSAVVNAVVNKE